MDSLSAWTDHPEEDAIPERSNRIVGIDGPHRQQEFPNLAPKIRALYKQ
jgi:hypothetical protein